MTLLDRLTSPGPKRILSLDGGGIRGALTLGFLEEVESLLRKRHERPDLTLSDYFDLIGGTSTGAIIASALAIGWTAADTKRLYLDLGGRIFGQRKLKRWYHFWRYKERLEAKFEINPLVDALQDTFKRQDGTLLTLGDDEIRTGLCIVAKRADTQSTWPLINHPNGKFYKDNAPIPLWQAVRASTAAPTYFIPERVHVGNQHGAFVDGGVSMANNPALQLFLLATLRGFPFHWDTGEHDLLLVSVGTGHWSRKKPLEEVLDSKLWNWAGEVPGMLMEDASWQNQLLLQYFSNTDTAWSIDEEIEDLSADLLTDQPSLTYLRYDVELSEEFLREELGLTDICHLAEELREMSAAENRHTLARVGERAAKVSIQDRHFPGEFNL